MDEISLADGQGDELPLSKSLSADLFERHLLVVGLPEPWKFLFRRDVTDDFDFMGHADDDKSFTRGTLRRVAKSENAFEFPRGEPDKDSPGVAADVIDVHPDSAKSIVGPEHVDLNVRLYPHTRNQYRQPNANNAVDDVAPG